MSEPPREGDPRAVLAARDIRKAFPGVKALDGASLTVRPGRLNALLGENGAGKSTLMNILAGVFPPDSGGLWLDGREVAFASPRESQAAGVAIIHQEFNLVPGLSVAENIFLGREPLTRWGLVDHPRMRRDAASLLARLSVDVDPAAPVERFAVATQQTVEIAKALAQSPRVLILDEPTSALTEQETTALFSILHQLKAEGVGLVYITHRLEELKHIADDATVLRDGRFIAEKRFAETTTDELVQLMVGRELKPPAPARRSASGPALEAQGVTLFAAGHEGPPRVEVDSLSVGRGEVVGLFGLMGAGRTELLQTLFGLHAGRSRMTLSVAGRPVVVRTPRDAIRAGIALAPEDRKGEGLVLGMPIVKNVTLASLERVTRWGLLRPAAEARVAGTLAERLRVKCASLSQPVRTLSGGNQQKVVLAKWLATQPSVLLLDEPTRGVDIGGKQEVYEAVRELADAGLGVLVASSEMPELLGLCDRILVMCQGRLTAELPRGEATEERLLRAALPDTQRRRPA